MRPRRLSVAVAAAAAVLFLAGCDTPEVKRLNDPTRYRDLANATFADADAESQLDHVFELRHGDTNARLRSALEGNHKVTPLKPPGFRQPAYPASQPRGNVVYVAVVVDVTGKPSDVICAPATGATLGAAQTEFVDRTVRQWRFAPATIDGEPVTAEASFRVETDGSTFVEYLPTYH